MSATDVAGGLLPRLVELAPEFAIYCAVQTGAFVPTFLMIRRVWPRHKDPWALADTLVSIAIFPALTGAALVACAETYHDVESRWRGITPAGRFTLMLYTSRTVLHVPVQSMQRMSRAHLFCMTLHHLLSVLCFGNGLLTGNQVFWGCLDTCCEMSTIFLNNLYICKEVTVGDKELKDLMPSWLYAANGFLLWLSFLVFRISLFPTWLYFWYRDVTESPSLTWDRSSALERYLYPSVTAMLLVLSTMWFVPVTKGMLKAFGIGAGSKAGKEAQADGKSD